MNNIPIIDIRPNEFDKELVPNRNYENYPIERITDFSKYNKKIETQFFPRNRQLYNYARNRENYITFQKTSMKSPLKGKGSNGDITIPYNIDLRSGNFRFNMNIKTCSRDLNICDKYNMNETEDDQEYFAKLKNNLTKYNNMDTDPEKIINKEFRDPEIHQRCKTEDLKKRANADMPEVKVRRKKISKIDPGLNKLVKSELIDARYSFGTTQYETANDSKDEVSEFFDNKLNKRKMSPIRTSAGFRKKKRGSVTNSLQTSVDQAKRLNTEYVSITDQAESKTHYSKFKDPNNLIFTNEIQEHLETFPIEVKRPEIKTKYHNKKYIENLRISKPGISARLHEKKTTLFNINENFEKLHNIPVKNSIKNNLYCSRDKHPLIDKSLELNNINTNNNLKHMISKKNHSPRRNLPNQFQKFDKLHYQSLPDVEAAYKIDQNLRKQYIKRIEEPHPLMIKSVISDNQKNPEYFPNKFDKNSKKRKFVINNGMNMPFESYYSFDYKEDQTPSKLFKEENLCRDVANFEDVFIIPNENNKYGSVDTENAFTNESVVKKFQKLSKKNVKDSSEAVVDLRYVDFYEKKKHIYEIEKKLFWRDLLLYFAKKQLDDISDQILQSDIQFVDPEMVVREEGLSGEHSLVNQHNEICKKNEKSEKEIQQVCVKSNQKIQPSYLIKNEFPKEKRSKRSLIEDKAQDKVISNPIKNDEKRTGIVSKNKTQNEAISNPIKNLEKRTDIVSNYKTSEDNWNKKSTEGVTSIKADKKINKKDMKINLQQKNSNTEPQPPSQKNIEQLLHNLKNSEISPKEIKNITMDKSPREIEVCIFLKDKQIEKQFQISNQNMNEFIDIEKQSIDFKFLRKNNQLSKSVDASINKTSNNGCNLKRPFKQFSVNKYSKRKNDFKRPCNKSVAYNKDTIGSFLLDIL